MRKERVKTILASVFALLIIPAALAGESAKQAGAKAAEQKVEQEAKQAAAQLQEGQTVVSDPEAAAAAVEPPDGEIDPPAEPQAVVKTKTKSNQSND